MSRPRGYNSVSTGGIFMKVDFWVFFEYLSRKYNFHQEWRVLYMKTNIYFWSYLAQFFLEREMFQTKIIEKIKTQFEVQ